uniref:DNA polymerase n=1 Tax=Caenorhabditis japonica TaxID=281687 RepID=A0A8R1E8M7_CAEJA
MVSSIDDLLKEIREKLNSGTVPLEMFQISKQLTRNPDQYADVKAQCHAAVAQRLNKSGKFHLRHNDIVEYVICEDGTENPATQRAYHRTEITDNKELKIDLQYYLAQQIHPVVSRLCAPIEETDAVRIAEDLGLDSTSYRRAAAAHASQRAAEEDCAWQQENYDLCEGISVVCPHSTCGQTNIIRDTFDLVTDATCPRYTMAACAKCDLPWTSEEHRSVVFNQVDRQMNDFVRRHHVAGLKCDEPTCEFKTRVQTMKWCREGLECIRCSTGVLRREYTSKQLFDQQMFFHHILDLKGAMSKLSGAQKMVTKPSGGSVPYDIEKRLDSQKMSSFVKKLPNEKALLTVFLAEINQYEPDMIVGHDLSATISLLVARLEKLKLEKWSRISRLNRSISIGKIGHSKSGQWELTAGRMMLDSKLAAMELTKSRSYDLTELASKLLDTRRREIYVNEIKQLYSDSKDLISLIGWSWNDLLLSVGIVVTLNALPLYMQISQIVGGIASRTMMGGRAERNEYLLLHAFEKAGLIAPDKYNAFENKRKKALENPEETADGSDEKKNGKAQYSGGLVLEPKKGLYETLILLLDFNSLYPSIIQEYNICYTTLEYAKDSDEQLSVPQSTDVEGVLPREIRKLVECRRDVKSLMKTEKNEAKKKQLDIRQMALKLTANSMYGCLGFQFSRFYAKPLAALVTAKGREILMHSKDLVEKMGYSVVYGDTDSIMINTNSMDLMIAKKLGLEIKKAVNKCHRLLELELDGVFKRMLLLKKKKYAALKINVDTRVEEKELKGLDIVRRDWSQLAKETGT